MQLEIDKITQQEGITPIRLTMVINCYFDKQSSALKDLLEDYRLYDSSLLDRLHIVIVDDASPENVSSSLVSMGDGDLNLTVLRIKENIPWNQGGARNLGVIYARSEVILLTDLDHYFPEDALRRLTQTKVPRKVIFKMARYRQKELVRSHPNTFLLCRSRFLELFGYDEEFSGNYGCDDEMFSYWQSMMGTRFRWLPKECAVHLRDFDVETETHDLTRDRAVNLELLASKRNALHAEGPAGGHSRKFLEFSWEVVLSSHRTPSSEGKPVTNAWWRLRLRMLERIRRQRSRSPYEKS